MSFRNALMASFNASFVGLFSQLANSRYKLALKFQQSLIEYLLAFAQEFFCLQPRTN